MSYTPCRYAKQWPDIWAALPTDADRRGLSAALADLRLEGSPEPTRDHVQLLADMANGHVSEADVIAAAQARQRKLDTA